MRIERMMRSPRASQMYWNNDERKWTEQDTELFRQYAGARQFAEICMGRQAGL